VGFLDRFNAIAVRIENNRSLQQFCMDNFGQALKVEKVFRWRKEIPITDLPIALVTRPYVRRSFEGMVPKKEQGISVYAGFRMEDQDKAVALSIEFEELLEDAICRKTSHPDDRPMGIMPADSTNDEGKFHPVYFLVMEVLVRDR